jgi:hypothetical protein
MYLAMSSPQDFYKIVSTDKNDVSNFTAGISQTSDRDGYFNDYMRELGLNYNQGEFSNNTNEVMDKKNVSVPAAQKNQKNYLEYDLFGSEKKEGLPLVSVPVIPQVSPIVSPFSAHESCRGSIDDECASKTSRNARGQRGSCKKLELEIPHLSISAASKKMLSMKRIPSLVLTPLSPGSACGGGPLSPSIFPLFGHHSSVFKASSHPITPPEEGRGAGDAEGRREGEDGLYFDSPFFSELTGEYVGGGGNNNNSK